MVENGKSRWIMWLVGALWGVIIISITSVTNNVIANDKLSRQRDDNLKEQIHNVEKGNSKRFEAIMCLLSELKTEQSLMKELVKNGQKHQR